eukprot:Amastigsp_a845329_5.p4 type:complete len:217 gc:universal Amastigsp_a845329_5:769-119(-)
MLRRVCRLAPSATARSRFSSTRRMPLRAQPSHAAISASFIISSSTATRRVTKYASMAWNMASKPVATVSPGGILENCGTRATILGRNAGWPKTCLTPFESVMTADLPASEPVPAVVGMAPMSGTALTKSLADARRVARSSPAVKNGPASWSRLRFAATSIMPPLVASSGPPPPSPTTASQPLDLNAFAMPTTSATPGSDLVVSNTALWMEAAPSAA